MPSSEAIMSGSPDVKAEDEVGSDVSFEEVSSNISDKRQESGKDDESENKNEPSKRHKIEGQVPPVLYVLQYLGFNNKVIESKHSHYFPHPSPPDL